MFDDKDDWSVVMRVYLADGSGAAGVALDNCADDEYSLAVLKYTKSIVTVVSSLHTVLHLHH